MEATHHLVTIPENKNITRSFSKAVFRQDVRMLLTPK